MWLIRIKKFLFWISVSLITFWILSPVMRLVVKIEWRTPELLESYQQFVRIGFPLAIFFAFILSIKKNEDASPITAKILAAVIFPIVSFGILLFSGFCGYVNRELFHEKAGSSKIIERRIDCGAIDSGDSEYRTVKVSPFLGYFNYITEIDTNKIDKNNWSRLELPI